MSRRPVALLLLVFALTRLVGAWLADHPDVYRGGVSPVGDPTLYRLWAERIVDQGAAPYVEVRIEYPPGSLPFLVAPHLVPGVSYRPALIALLVAVDLLGLIAVLRMARRRGSLMGAWLWTALIPVLGPIAYLRLDLIPAVATLWAMERASAGRWLGAGGWLGFGVATKLYPLALLPAAYLATPRRGRFIAGAALVLGLALLPFAATPRGLFRSVLGYHLERGIEVESLWGGILLTAAEAGHPTRFRFDFLSLNVVSPVSPALEVVSAALAVVAVVAGAWLTLRMSPSDRQRRLPAVLFGTMVTVVAVATVLSPQYLLWLIPLAAAAASDPSNPIRWEVLALIPACALTQAIYPFLFDRLAAGEAVPLVLLWARNLLLLAAGAWALFRLRDPTDA